MQRAIDILAIKVPKTYSGGTYLSDFDVEDIESSDAPPDSPPEDVPEEAQRTPLSRSPGFMPTSEGVGRHPGMRRTWWRCSLGVMISCISLRKTIF